MIKGGHPNEVELTPEEKQAINALKRLARKWPKSLWVFCGEGFNVMRRGSGGEQVATPLDIHHTGVGDGGGGVDQEYFVASIDIPCDGGGW